MRYGLTIGVGLLFLLGCDDSPPPEKVAKSGVDFAKDILPIFKAHCFQCHDARRAKSGLRLDIKSKA